MAEDTGIAKTPREHFSQDVDDELAKFQRKERARQQIEPDEAPPRVRLLLPAEIWRDLMKLA